MQVGRRAVLAGVAAALSGCADVIEGAAGTDGHPMEGTVTVEVVDRSGSDHDLEELAAEAMVFWEDNAPQYAGFEVEYRWAAEDREPDLEVVFLEDRSELEGCREHASEEILGCAPVLGEGDRAPSPVTAEVVATDRPYGEVRNTARHELGHTLGLGHDDEPAYVMSNDVRDRLPEYGSRLSVVEAVEAAWEARNEGTSTYNDGIARWNDDEYEAAAETFRAAADRAREVGDLVAGARADARAFEGMERPETVDLPRLRDQLEAVERMGTLLVEAAEAMAEAAGAAADGDRSVARDRRETARERIEELRSTEFPSPVDVGASLGLVREET